MPANKKVGVSDIAKHAGVSIGTVSNVLNRPEVVSEDRRRRVLRVIEDLGYVRNDVARQLKKIVVHGCAIRWSGADCSTAHHAAKDARTP